MRPDPFDSAQVETNASFLVLDQSGSIVVQIRFFSVSTHCSHGSRTKHILTPSNELLLELEEEPDTLKTRPCFLFSSLLSMNLFPV